MSESKEIKSEARSTDNRPDWRAPELTSYPADSAETIAVPGPEATFTS